MYSDLNMGENYGSLMARRSAGGYERNTRQTGGAKASRTSGKSTRAPSFNIWPFLSSPSPPFPRTYPLPTRRQRGAYYAAAEHLPGLRGTGAAMKLFHV